MVDSSTQVLILKDCQPGQEITGFLAVRKSSAGRTNQGTGKPFLAVTLSDGQTDIDGKQWNYDGPLPPENTVIKVRATVDIYQENPQLKITEWRPAKEGECTQEFIPVSPRDIVLMTHQLSGHIESITHQGLRKLVLDVIGIYAYAFDHCPASLAHHHNYVGGLLEHTLGVVDTALKLAFGEEVDENLLLAGAILHDIGKIWSYDWKGCSIVLTDEGKLYGHLVKSLQIIHEYAFNRVFNGELDRETYQLLVHLIASHHGKLEWGSPVEPVTREAVILHQADLIDMTMWKINKAAAETKPGTWTPKIYGINRSFYVPEKVMADLRNFGSAVDKDSPKVADGLVPGDKFTFNFIEDEDGTLIGKGEVPF